MKKIGFIVNPIAGIGGRVGLKGTDSIEIQNEALKRGAIPIAADRTRRFLSHFSKFPEVKNVEFFIPKGKMGEEIFHSFQQTKFVIKYFVLDEIIIPDLTTSRETILCVKKLVSLNVDLIIFVGGDGTARDLHQALKSQTPILGIPSGVKMHSGVFAQSPEKGAEILRKFVMDEVYFMESEIIDLNEEKFRKDSIQTELYGLGIIPYVPTLMQSTKLMTKIEDTELENIEGIVKTLKNLIKEDVIYILGAGSTIKQVSKAFGSLISTNKTVLGIDAVINGTFLGKDLSEYGLLEILNKNKEREVIILLTPIGGQGFILGRGNQQISPNVLQIVGINNILIIASKNKLNKIERKTLHVDTGDLQLDEALIGYVKVLVDFEEYMMVKIS